MISVVAIISFQSLTRDSNHSNGYQLRDNVNVYPFQSLTRDSNHSNPRPVKQLAANTNHSFNPSRGIAIIQTPAARTHRLSAPPPRRLRANPRYIAPPRPVMQLAFEHILPRTQLLREETERPGRNDGNPLNHSALYTMSIESERLAKDKSPLRRSQLDHHHLALLRRR